MWTRSDGESNWLLTQFPWYQNPTPHPYGFCRFLAEIVHPCPEADSQWETRSISRYGGAGGACAPSRAPAGWLQRTPTHRCRNRHQASGGLRRPGSLVRAMPTVAVSVGPDGSLRAKGSDRRLRYRPTARRGMRLLTEPIDCPTGTLGQKTSFRVDRGPGVPQPKEELGTNAVILNWRWSSQQFERLREPHFSVNSPERGNKPRFSPHFLVIACCTAH